MVQPLAYGTFTQKGNDIFRTSAYIQWGSSTESLGACLLLNPGSSTGSSTGEITEITIDPTMKQLVSFVQRVYEGEQPISGRLHIYNLFNLRDASSIKAIEKFEKLVSSGEYHPEESLITIDDLKMHPWILLGWGVMYKSKWRHLKTIKDNWIKLILDSDIPSFGKTHKNRKDFYHPCPLISTQRPLMLEELIRHYKSTLTQNAGTEKSQEEQARFGL
ncbi:hypothetical protein [Metabacillus sp. 84]|uniref:hypothetical protein n=1 Tax=unclassified Metabacillus TaxID=2675274 RepID=UPI003CF24D89